MKLCQAVQARCLAVLGPTGEEPAALLLDLGWCHFRGATDTKSLKEGLVDEAALETGARVGDEGVHDGQGTQLSVSAAILEFLAQSAGGFRRTGRLELDDLDKIDQAAQVVLLIRLGREDLDLGGDSRVRLFLKGEVSTTRTESC